MNYVFPVRTNAPDGYYRELCGLFELTEPLSWAAGMALPDSGLNRPQYKHGGVLDAADRGIRSGEFVAFSKFWDKCLETWM